MIGTTISHYRILAPLGSGGMGVVYEAEDIRLGRRVAIKFLPEAAYRDPEAVQRFQREARVISSLNHPHICTLHDLGEHDQRQFMVMERLEGETLKARLARGAMPPDEVLTLGVQMADALDAAHAKGIVHRDLKPANLFLTTRGQIKVLDFGVAKLSGPAPGSGGGNDETLGGSGQLTVAGSTVGTIAYMSPEQARGQEIDARSDLFSLGVVLFEMATGAPPFQGATPAVVFEGILTRNPLPPSQLALGVTPDFDRVVARALEKDRETRYQSAADLRAELKRLSRATESGVAAASAFAKTTADKSDVAHPAADQADVHEATADKSSTAKAAADQRRRPWAWMLGAPAATALVIAGIVLWRSSSTPALSETDNVVLADFTNRTGDTMFDGTLSEALGGQLRQSTFLKVYPEQQVQATLRLMGRDPMSPVTPEVGRDLCQRLGGKAMLGGAIAAVGSSYLITLNARDCVTGAIVAEEQVQAPNKDGVLRALGEAAAAFRGRLGESLASIQRTNTRVEMATTPSLDALKAYSEGMTTRRIKGDFDSIPFFKRALELDGTFALAHARISTVYSNVGDLDLSKQHSTRAYELRERVSDRERYYIEARYYSTVEPDPDKAMDAYRRLLAAYPGDFAAHTNLASLQRQQGQLDAAIANFEAAMKVAPDQPLPVLNAGYAYLDAQRLADARRTFERALSLQDATNIRQGLFQVGILTGDQALADAQVEAMRGRRDEAGMVGLRVQGLIYQGRFKEAAELAPQFLRMMEQAQRSQFVGEAMTGLAIAEAVAGFEDRARARLADLRQRKLILPGSADERLILAFILRDAALAREALPETLKLAAEAPPQFREENARVFRAMDALANGDGKQALAGIEPVTMDGPRTRVVVFYAEALIEVGRHAEAVTALQWLLSKDARLGMGVSKPHAMATLARQLARTGRTAEARKAYEEFFAFWPKADPDVPIVVRARAEHAKLGS